MENKIFRFSFVSEVRLGQDDAAKFAKSCCPSRTSPHALRRALALSPNHAKPHLRAAEPRKQTQAILDVRLRLVEMARVLPAKGVQIGIFAIDFVNLGAMLAVMSQSNAPKVVAAFTDRARTERTEPTRERQLIDWRWRCFQIFNHDKIKRIFSFPSDGDR